jgi:hypothetical protein
MARFLCGCRGEELAFVDASAEAASGGVLDASGEAESGGAAYASIPDASGCIADDSPYGIPCAQPVSAYLLADGAVLPRCSSDYAAALADPQCVHLELEVSDCGGMLLMDVPATDTVNGCFYDTTTGALIAVVSGSPYGSACAAGPSCFLWPTSCGKYADAPCGAADAGTD